MFLMPTVVQAVPGDDFTVYAYCNDGAVRLVDVKPLIAWGGVFAPLADPDFFRDTVAWDIAGNRDTTTCVDLDADQIFAEAPVVADPLEDKRAG